MTNAVTIDSRGRGLPVLALARVELVAGVRTGFFRFMCLLAFALGWSAGGALGRGAAASAYAAGEAAWQYVGFLAIIWMSLAAVRDASLRTDILVFSKPQPTERIVLSRFAGFYVQVLLILLALFLGAVASRLAGGNGLAGSAAYLLQYGRVAGVLFFACAAAYSLALLANTPVAGVLVALYWIVTLAGKSFLSKVYFPAYTQNLTAYLLIGVVLLSVSALFYRRRRRGASPAPLWARAAAPIGVVLAANVFLANYQQMHDPPSQEQPGLERITEQNIVMDARAPGFTLPDQGGRPTSLSDFPNRILIIAMFSPQDPESALALSHLQDMAARFGSQGVQPVAVCLSEDAGAAPTFARGESVSYPVVADWGTHNAPKPSEMSPVAAAYQADLLPKLAVTDRRRRVRAILTGIDTYDGKALEQLIDERLKEEPE